MYKGPWLDVVCGQDWAVVRQLLRLSLSEGTLTIRNFHISNKQQRLKGESGKREGGVEGTKTPEVPATPPGFQKAHKLTVSPQGPRR